MTTGPDPWPHPRLYSAMGLTALGCSEMGGPGLLYAAPTLWDDVVVSRFTVMTAAQLAGSGFSVDFTVKSENRTFTVTAPSNVFAGSGGKGKGLPGPLAALARSMPAGSPMPLRPRIARTKVEEP